MGIAPWQIEWNRAVAIEWGLADNVRACPCSSGGESSGFLNRARRFESGQGYHAGTGDHVKSDWRAGHTTRMPRPPRMERTTFLAWST